jgi:GNAT superfamily N-acetyltransferase
VTLLFREAHRHEVGAVVALLQDDALGVLREGSDLAPYLAAFDRMAQEGGNIVVVGVQAARIVATYQLTFISGLSLAGARRAQVESVRVASDLRGQGLGRRMIEDAVARAEDAGCGLVQLTMNKCRTDSARFYEGLGFTPSHIGYKRYLS